MTKETLLFHMIRRAVHPVCSHLAKVLHLSTWFVLTAGGHVVCGTHQSCDPGQVIYALSGSSGRVAFRLIRLSVL